MIYSQIDMNIYLFILHWQFVILIRLPFHPLGSLTFLLIISLLHLIPIGRETRPPRSLHTLDHGTTRILIGIGIDLLEEFVECLVPLGFFGLFFGFDVGFDGVPVAVGGVGSIFGGCYSGDLGWFIVGGGARGSRSSGSGSGGLVIHFSSSGSGSSVHSSALLNPTLLPLPTLTIIQQLHPLQLTLLLLQLDKNLLILNNSPALLHNNLLIQIPINNCIFRQHSPLI
mmetsp:Transcript_19632/g.29264  ORF Transcript_19632/g.29264 Transcript_19632/m.29264 type:complete len:227 (+) Transcript_19632:1909-2589(+)